MINRLFKILQLPFYIIVIFLYHILGFLLIPVDIITYIFTGKGSLFLNMCGIGADIFDEYLTKL